MTSQRTTSVNRSIFLSIGLVVCGVLLLVVLHGLAPRLGGLFLNSVLVALVASAVALPVGITLGEILARTDVFGRTVWIAITCATAMIPLVLIAAAWDAGMGRLGWWQWVTDGDVADRRWSGITGAGLVHGFAAVPWIFVLAFAASSRDTDELDDAIRLESGNRLSRFWLSWHRQSTLIATGFFAVIVLSFGEIVVSDLYQVRTVAEEIYIGLPLSQMFNPQPLATESNDEPGLGWLASPGGVATIAWVLLCACFVLSTVGPAVEGVVSKPRKRIRLRRLQWPATALVVGLLTLVVFIPVTNLLIKVGFTVSVTESGGEPSWSLSQALSVLLAVPNEYRYEWMWTAMIGGAATIASIVIFGGLAWVGSHSRYKNWHYGRWLFLLMLSALLAIPGPLIGTWLIRVFNHDVSWLIYLYDRTIAPPAVAGMLKVGPWFGVFMWAIVHSIRADVLESASSEGAGLWTRLFRIAIPLRWRLLLAATLVTFLLMLGELSASLLVIPPGIDTMPRVVFGQLHAGVYDQVAAVCLFQWALFAIVSILALLLAGIGRSAKEGMTDRAN